MDAPGPTPRVNFQLMQKNVGNMVLLVGEVTCVESDKIQLKTSDGSSVTVMTKPAKQFESKYVEVLGRVVDATTIQEEDHTNFGETFGTGLAPSRPVQIALPPITSPDAVPNAA